MTIPYFSGSKIFFFISHLPNKLLASHVVHLQLPLTKFCNLTQALPSFLSASTTENKVQSETHFNAFAIRMILVQSFPSTAPSMSLNTARQVIFNSSIFLTPVSLNILTSLCFVACKPVTPAAEICLRIRFFLTHFLSSIELPPRVFFGFKLVVT